MLTVVALPYIRVKYGSQFSILKLNSAILILHLSLCDLLYAVVGFPHLIHAYIYDENLYPPDLCFILGVSRNIIAYTDFNTITIISCCIARQLLCRLDHHNNDAYLIYMNGFIFRECSGSPLTHDQHDAIFGGKRVYLVCLAAWIVSTLVLWPDISGVGISYPQCIVELLFTFSYSRRPDLLNGRKECLHVT